MAKFQSILETIGNTPLIQMPGVTRHLGAHLWFKLEFFNPLSSVKDRIASAMILEAEHRGELRPGMRIIEPTSGNTGIGLAFVCAAKGYRLTLVMPETMNLKEILCIKEFRAVAPDQTVSIQNKRMLIQEPLRFQIKGQKVELRTYQDLTVKYFFAGKPITLIPIEAPLKIAA